MLDCAFLILKLKILKNEGSVKIVLCLNGSLYFFTTRTEGCSLAASTTSGYSLVGSPGTVYQVVELGTAGELVLSTAAAIIENGFFFYTIFPTAFGLIWFLTKNPYIAFFIAAFFIAPGIFTAFHWGVYGTVKLAATTSVYIFGVINCVLVFVFRNPIFSDVLHCSNNISVILGQAKKIGFFIVAGGG